MQVYLIKVHAYKWRLFRGIDQAPGQRLMWKHLTSEDASIVHPSVAAVNNHPHLIIYWSDYQQLSTHRLNSDNMVNWMKQIGLNETTKFIITETIKYLQSQWYSKRNSYKTVVYRVLLLFVWLLHMFVHQSLLTMHWWLNVSSLIQLLTTQHKNPSNIKVQISPSWP